MLAHLPNRFNSLTRGRVRATSTPPENHYNGAKLFAFTRFAFARSRVCTNPRRLARSFCCCYDCHCVRNYCMHSVRAYIYRSVIVSADASVRGKRRRSCSPFSARPFYHAQVPEASEHKDDDVTSCAGVATVSSIACTG